MLVATNRKKKVMTRCGTTAANQNHVAGDDKKKQDILSTPGKVCSPVWKLFGLRKKDLQEVCKTLQEVHINSKLVLSFCTVMLTNSLSASLHSYFEQNSFAKKKKKKEHNKQC